MDTNDYTKPYTKLYDLLPSVYKSEFNKSLTRDVFDRFLTKPELVNIVGTLTQDYNDSRRIPESEVQRQNYQLQPLLYTKIATEDYVSSFKDLMGEARNLGINYDRLNEWVGTSKFNFCPPVDIDKLINYQNYYWYEKTKPQYITIKNRYYQLEIIIKQAFNDIPELIPLIQEYTNATTEVEKEQIANEIEALYPSFVLIYEEFSYNQSNQINNIINRDGWDAIVDGIPLIEINRTTKQLVVVDYFVDIFDFFFNEGIQIELRSNTQQYALTINSTALYDPVNNKTTITVFEDIPLPVTILDYTINLGNYDRITNGAPVIAWGTNSITVPGNYLDQLRDLESINVIDSIANNNTYTVESVFYNVSIRQTIITVQETIPNLTDTGMVQELGMYDKIIHPINEIPNPYNFTLQNDAWSNENRWVHVSDIPSNVNTATLQQAEQPIIEYEPFIELNEWSMSKYNWLYSSNGLDNYKKVDYEPIDDEMLSFKHSYPVTEQVDNIIKIYVPVDDSYFVVDNQITLILDTTEFEYYTILDVVRDIPNNTVSLTLDRTITNSYSTAFVETMRYTSRGDDWRGFRNHWIYEGYGTPIPCDSQLVSPVYDINSDEHDPQRYEDLTAAGELVNWYQLNTIYITPFDQIRVYVNGLRNYGTYELGYTEDGVDFTYDKQNGINAIWFMTAIPSGTIHIEVGPIALSDEEKRLIPVRTDASNPDQVTSVSLVKYYKNEQLKTEGNQYPLFNLYNLNGVTANKVGSIWKFLEDPTYPINSRTNKRDKIDNETTFYYEQSLLDENTGRIYAYKQKNQIFLIWKTDFDNVVYEPKFINTKFEEVPIGDPTGDWELPAQMLHNFEHENRKVLSSIDVFQHFNSILNSQSPTPGYTGNGNGLWRLKNAPEYGAGGTIKEFSDSFDLFLTTLFVPGFNYIQLIDFAQQQYSSNLNALQNLYCDSIPTLLVTTEQTGLLDFENFVYEYVKNEFEDIDYLLNIYGDTTMYDKYSHRGVRNWIASLAKFGLVPVVEPKLLIDDSLNLTLVTHHDGHQSNIALHTSTKNTILERVLKQGNTGSGLYTNRPAISIAPMGYVYYATDTKILYKNIIASFGSIPPSDLPIGALWYDTYNSSLKQNTISGYVIVPNDYAWKNINLNNILGTIEYNIEKRLYDFNRGTVSVYPISFVQSDIEYPFLEQKAFYEFVQENQIANPLLNASFSYTNPFSWNYKSVNVSLFNFTPPSTWVTNGVPSTWYNMYENLYGTRYPHLEPWILQNYTVKPSWWDEYYHTSPTRRWNTDMWLNIRRGDVPKGKLYPNGIISSGALGDIGYIIDEGIHFGNTKSYTKIPVNIMGYSTSDGVYKPDDLLPPFLSSTDADDQIIINYGSLLIGAPPMNIVAQDYVYGDNGPIEDVWRHSIEFNYDLTKIAYVVDPVRFTYYTFGIKNKLVGNVQVDIELNKISSHKTTLFHGDLVDGFPLAVNGFNQWIVNFLRYKSQDIDISNFREIWSSWKPVLSYQTGSFVDNRNVILSTDSSIFDESDYQLIRKTTPGFKDCFLDSLRVAVSNVGSYVINKGVQVPSSQGADWTFKIMTNNPKFATIRLYDVDTNSDPITFKVLDQLTTSTVWNHYPANKNSIHEFIPGHDISVLGTKYQGVQGLINFIDGYRAFLEDQGFVYNDTEYAPIDEVYGRIVDWQFETEKMIEQIYIGLATDKLPINFMGKWNQVVVDLNTNEMIFVNTANFNNNELIQFVATGSIPLPLVENELYEIVNRTGNRFQLRNSQGIVNLQSIGRGVITCGLYRIETTVPQAYYEVNPFKNVVVFSHPQGLVSNINTGSFTDILYQTGIYDQYGRLLDSTALKVYRTDQKTIIKFNSLPDDITLGDTLHMGGMHLYVDGYEHALMLSNTSLEQGLIFDEFLGIRISKININIRLGYKDTLRPNVGGRFNNEDLLIPNFEASIHELQHMYDTYVADEDSPLTKVGRKLLGYEEKDYLTQIGITPKSQFVFYRGMIQQKGSINAINAYINLRRFIDAKVDEYWAYKVNDFGDSRQKIKPQLQLNSTDTYSNKLMLQFVDNDDSVVVDDYIRVTTDDKRWKNPSLLQREVFINDQNLFFDANCKFKNELTWADVDNQGFLKHTKTRDLCIVVPQASQYQFVMDIARYPTKTFTTNIPFVMDKDSILITITRNNSVYYTVDSNLFELISNTQITINGFIVGEDIWSLEDGDIINITIKTSVLKESIHYSRINNNYILFDLDNPVQQLEFTSQLLIYGFDVHSTKITPLRLYDTMSDADVERVIVWDPINDLYDVNSIFIVDFKGNDPSIYNNSPVIPERNINKAWDYRKNKKVWMDTSKLRYKPYNDSILYPSLDQRLQMWGQQHEWSTMELYEWTESTIHPKDYEQYVIDQQKAGEVISGVPKKTLFATIRNGSDQLFNQPWIEVNDIIIDDYVPLVQGNIIDISSIRDRYENDLLTQGYPVDYITYASQYYINNGDIFTVYKNGIKTGEGVISSNSIDLTPFSSDSHFFFTIIVNKTKVTEQQLEFNPEIKDDLSVDVWYKYDFKYTDVKSVADDGVTEKHTYYFWVANTATVRNGLTFQQAKVNLNKTSLPYLVVDNFIYKTEKKPYCYSRIVVRGLVNRVTSDDRYVLQFVKDLTLRDDLNDDISPLILKNKHSQWKMFRQRQRFNIDRYLWNKLIETCSGRSLSDSSKLVPSLDYILNDDLNSTSYRFGIMDGQTMMQSSRAIQIIIDEINNPDYNLYPIDRVEFLKTHTFDSPETIEEVMNLIYETFLPEHVNRIWFSVFLESLSFNTLFKNVMKTSWIQLDGVRLLDTSGVLNNGSD